MFPTVCSSQKQTNARTGFKQRNTHTSIQPEPDPATDAQTNRAPSGVGWTTWWLWRGDRTRSHPELGRENPQRPWYCGPSRGRVGRRQVFQPTLSSVVGNQGTPHAATPTIDT